MRSGRVAEVGAIAGSEHGAHVVTEDGPARVTYRVDPPVLAEQPSFRDPAADPVDIDPLRVELLDGDPTVLACRDPADDVR